jgi:hypothetical protein
MTCRAGSDHFAFEDEGLESALGEMKGNAGAHHARTNNNGIVGLCHMISFFATDYTDKHGFSFIFFL